MNDPSIICKYQGCRYDLLARDLTASHSVIERLLLHLDREAEPERGVDQDGNPVEWRNWLQVHCFSGDHELYDDVFSVLGGHRALNLSREPGA